MSDYFHTLYAFFFHFLVVPEDAYPSYGAIILHDQVLASGANTQVDATFGF